MRIVLLLPLLFLSFILTFGQKIIVSGIVSDSDNQKELPFANIMVLGHTLGTTTNSHGFFELNLPDSLRNDSLVISFVGYQTLILCINDVGTGLIKLKPHISNITEVVISPSNKSQKPIIINQFNKKDCSVRYSPINTDLSIPFRPMEPTIEALYFKNSDAYEGNRKVKEVWLQVSTFKTPPAYFNLRIFNADDDLTPSNDLINESITVKVTETNQLIKVNLEEYNLSIPDNGLFVGFELLIIDDNKSSAIDKKGSNFTLYSPFLNFLRLEDEQHFWLYTKGKWVERIQETPHSLKKNLMLFYKPAISLVL